ncbi:alcohol dehydrogenase catalytic domain-containing protein [Streptomyces sp. NPDC051211]|uniref:alcohol dehydrogenase catalytic domain-containing protein n=1 Tax=Streptomyces sp. NPDC051211 TaxID=3154643 RepID=UPI00344E436C
MDFFGEPPFVLGHEFSGVVDEVGEGSAGSRPGDEVYGWVTPHTAATPTTSNWCWPARTAGDTSASAPHPGGRGFVSRPAPGCAGRRRGRRGPGRRSGWSTSGGGRGAAGSGCGGWIRSR